MSDSLYTEKAYDLDITGFTDKGRKLAKAIEDAVKGTQSVIFRAYPDKIVMSIKQYNMLTGKPEMMLDEYEGQEYYMYRTPWNIMEVVVKE